jgi:hypothetical protein
MGVMRPRDPRTMDPESAKRLASGFWHHSYDMETCITSWRCDKRKLNDRVAEAMHDRDFLDAFQKHGFGILDRIFGEGTSKAYAYNVNGPNDIVSMKIRDEEKEMATGYWVTGTTTTDASTTGGTMNISNNTFTDSRPRHIAGSVQERPNAPPPHKQGRLVTRVPFKVETGGSLVRSLQREFDRWAKPQMVMVHG